MKHWSGHIFPILLLAVLAGLTYWLQGVVDGTTLRNTGKLRHDPDAVAENFTVRQFDETGQVKYRLSGPYLIHYPDDESSELQSPTLISFRPASPPITITANHARATAKGEVVYLWDDVRVVRAATARQAALLYRSPDLTVQTETGFAFTASPVEITQGQSQVTGVGAQIDRDTSTFTLLSQVKGQYIRPKAQP